MMHARGHSGLLSLTHNSTYHILPRTIQDHNSDTDYLELVQGIPNLLGFLLFVA